jgi:hypothetical protein
LQFVIVMITGNSIWKNMGKFYINITYYK